MKIYLVRFKQLILTKTNNSVQKKKSTWADCQKFFAFEKLKLSHLALNILLAVFCAYLVVNLSIIPDHIKVSIAFFIVNFIVTLSMILLTGNIGLIIILCLAAIISTKEAVFENIANSVHLHLKNKYMPTLHHLSLFIATFFIAFLIMYCMNFEGVHWGYTIYMCGLVIISLLMFTFYNAVTYSMLDATLNKVSCYMMEYNYLPKYNQQLV